jgi:hypothetical protein
MQARRILYGLTLGGLASVLCCVHVYAQDGTPGDVETIHLVVEKGAPMWLALAKPLPAKHAGESVDARLMEPIYAFDRIVVPAGTEVLGHVTLVTPVSHHERERAILAGDFTPLRKAQIEFDTLVFKDGKRVLLQTKVSEGLPEVVHLESASSTTTKHQSQASQVKDMAKQEINAKRQEAMDAIETPGKLKRLEARALAMLPYHSQTMPAGTRFDAELLAPLDFGTIECPVRDLVKIGSPDPPVGVVHARLITPLSSATAHQGNPVEAVISQPMYTADHHLILPVGSRLEGTVLQATPARRMNRTGSLRFTFRRAVPPSGLAQTVEGSLTGVAANRQDHIKLDAEGGAHATHPKSGYVLPVLDVMLASSTLDGLDHHAHLEHRHYDGPDPGRAATGGIGFGLIGTIAALSSHVAAAGFGFYGAGWGVYNRFIARGTEVVFPMDTPMEITLGSHGGPPKDSSSERKFTAAN